MYVDSSKEKNQKIAEALLKEKLIACANIIPSIESIFIWDNQVNYEQESMMIIKCPTDNIESIKQVTKSNHEYEVPEIIFSTIQDGYQPYLDWIKNTTINKK